MNHEGFLIQNYLQTKIKDESFDVDLLGQFELCIELIGSSFNFCVIDTQSQRCLLLESYTLPSYPGKSVKDHLELVFEDHHFLMAGFWKTVKISLFNKQFSLVPYPFFEEASIDKYIRVNSSFSPDTESLYHYKHDASDAVNVFAVNADLINWMKSFYPASTVKIVHHTSSLIQGVMKDQNSLSLKSLYVVMNKGFFTVVVKNENQLQYCNIFSFATPDECIFYLLFVATTLNINRKSTRVVLFGEIEKESEIYSRINEYFEFVSFGYKPSYLKFGYVFDEIPDHHFFELFSIYHC